MQVTRTKTLVLLSALVIFSSSLVAFALTALFTQTIPGQTFTTTTTTTSTSTTSAAGLVEGDCGNSLVLDTGDGSIPSSAGQSAILIFACSVATTGSPVPAFTLTSSLVTATPTFTLPSGWSLSVDSLADNPSTVGTCRGGPYEASLTSGSSITLTNVAGFVYCLTSSSASTFSSFSVTWSQ